MAFHPRVSIQSKGQKKNYGPYTSQFAWDLMDSTKIISNVENHVVFNRIKPFFFFLRPIKVLCNSEKKWICFSTSSWELIPFHRAQNQTVLKSGGWEFNESLDRHCQWKFWALFTRDPERIYKMLRIPQHFLSFSQLPCFQSFLTLSYCCLDTKPPPPTTKKNN